MTWALDPAIDFLNHGSFGACLEGVLVVQQRWRDEMEAEPPRFFLERFPEALEEARASLAAFIGADVDGLVFVRNATTGVNAVIRSLEGELAPGDQLLTTDHAYNAVGNALAATAARTGAQVVTSRIPFPLADADEAVEAVLAEVNGRTRLLVVENVTSPTALVLPVEEIVARLEPDVPVLVDGAHAPGMVPLGLRALGASFYVGNCHKWLGSPKGAGFLHVREDHRDRMIPPVISHGWNDAWPASTHFHAMFDWSGTDDPSPFLSVPAALNLGAALHPRGWEGVMAANHSLALEARGVLCEALVTPPPAPQDMIGSMAALPLPPGDDDLPPGQIDPLSGRLRELGISVPVMAWPAPPQRVIRVSAHVYNSIDQYRRLGRALADLLA